MGNWPRILRTAILMHLAMSGAAAGQLIDATDPETILALIQELGDASLDKDNMGDPIIRGQTGGKDYELLFYDCSENRECKTVMFRADWQAKEVADEAIADWNRERRFGKAFSDEDGRIVLEMNVNLRGGVSPANLEHTIDWWRLVLDQFVDELKL